MRYTMSHKSVDAVLLRETHCVLSEKWDFNHAAPSQMQQTDYPVSLYEYTMICGAESQTDIE